MALDARGPARWLAPLLVVGWSLSACVPRAAPIPVEQGRPGSGAGATLAAGVDPGFAAHVDDVVTRSHPHIRAILIARDGVLILERYYHGASAADPSDVYSITNTVMSMLVGTAMADGAIRDLDQTVGELLPEQVSPATAPDVSAITLRQLLTMTAGLPPNAPDEVQPPFASRADWVRHVLDGGTFVPPGRVFVESNANAHLLSVIVTEVTGRPTLQYAQERLFGPLGLQPGPSTPPAAFAWAGDPQGYQLGFGSLTLTARDLVRLGQLYLDGGRGNGRQIVPAEYVLESTRPAGTPGSSDRYGYHWWIGRPRGHDSFWAEGYGGQLVQVIPDLRLVVVVSSDVPPSGPPENGGGLQSLLRSILLPPVEAQAAAGDG